MIGAVLMLAASQSGGVPPVSVGRDAYRAVPARTANCTLGRGAGESPFELAARLPAVPLEAQTEGRAYRLEAALTSPTIKQLAGTFPANLTFSVGDLSRYSILSEGESGDALILQFELYGASGFVNVTAHGAKGSTTAYATGLCTFKASDR